MQPLILVSVFLIATCGLIYELIAGTVSSYLLGDSVMQFSTIIGVYLSAMGVGSYLARYIGRGVLQRFVQIQILVGLLGGCSASVLFFVFAHGTGFSLVLYSLVFAIGTLVGLEIPLVMRLLKDQLEFKELVSQVLALDYIGALAASLAFPILLVPHLGLVRTAFLFGLVNVGVALAFLVRFSPTRQASRLLLAQAVLAFLLLASGLALAERLTTLAEVQMFPDQVLLARSTPYQRLVVTQRTGDLRLYLNNNLQFSSLDEYRYHETLVHPGLSGLENPRKVLILGGGDGLALREVLRYPTVSEITLVDLDPGMTELFSQHPLLSKLNEGSLRSPRVKVVNADAFVWLREDPGNYDFVVVDFPDPSTFALGKLYTLSFYAELKRHLAPGGAAAVQCTSPLFARRSYWCILKTMEAAGLQVRPYHVFVPSFGEWGFALIGPSRPGGHLPTGLRFLNQSALAALFEFPLDMSSLPVEVNRLSNQALVRYYEEEWRAVAQ